MCPQQALNEQNGEGIPIGGFREIRPFTKISHAIQIGINKGKHGHWAGEAAKLIAVDIDEGWLVGLGIGGWGLGRGEIDVGVVEIANDYFLGVQGGDCLVDCL